MPLDLPEPLDEHLVRSPLQLVVCQLRYPEVLAAADPRVGVAVQEALGSGWKADQLERQRYSIVGTKEGLAGSPSVEVRRGWRIVSSDETWIATVAPDSTGLETTSYLSWEDFSKRFLTLLRALVAKVQPEAETRLGLRYINRLEEPAVDSPSKWKQWIRGEILGIVQYPEFGKAALAAQQQVDLEADEGLRATVRHGFLREGPKPNFVYVLDFDTFREGLRRLDIDDVQAALLRLNRLARQLFQSMLTPDMYNFLRGGG